MKTIRFGLGTLALLAGLTAGPRRTAADSSNGQAPLAPAAPASGVAFDLTLWNGSPYIDVNIEGATGRFLFDTGANTSGIDGAWLRTSGVPYSTGATLSLTGTTGITETPTIFLSRFDLADGYFSHPSFVVENFSDFGEPGGEPEAGLLGMDLLSAYAVTLDLAHARAVLMLESERPAPAPNETALPLDLWSTGVPTVTANLSGVQLPCRLDTGSAYIVDRPYLDVNEATVSALERAGITLIQTGSVAVAGVTGTETLPLLEAEWSRNPALSLAVGPVTIQGIVLVVHTDGTLDVSTPVALAGAPVIGQLGTFRIDPFDDQLWITNP